MIDKDVGRLTRMLGGLTMMLGQFDEDVGGD